MKSTVILPVSLAALIASLVSCERGSSPSSSAGATNESALELFNGRDLDGWTGVLAEEDVAMEDVWSVRDGLLVCTGEPMGYLATTETFTDFALVVEWRWAPGGEPGNSGIFLRVNGEPKPLPRGMEVQLKSGDAGHVFGFHDMKLGGDPTRLRTIENHELGGNITALDRIEAAEVEPGEWNRAEIKLRQGDLTVTLNGKLVNEASDCEVIPGQLALQSEGGEIHFRKVELTPLAEAAR